MKTAKDGMHCDGRTDARRNLYGPWDLAAYEVTLPFDRAGFETGMIVFAVAAVASPVAAAMIDWRWKGSPPVSIPAPKRPARDAPRRITVLLFSALAVYFAVATVVLYGITVAGPTSLSRIQWDLVETNAVLHCVGLAVAAVAAAAVRGRRHIMSRWPRIAALMVLVAVLVSADRLVGIAFPPPTPADPIFKLHPTRGWTNRPNGYGCFRDFMVRFDERGLRIDTVQRLAEYLGLEIIVRPKRRKAKKGG